MSLCSANPQELSNTSGKGIVQIVLYKHKETLLVFVIVSLILHLVFPSPAVAQEPFDSKT